MKGLRIATKQAWAGLRLRGPKTWLTLFGLIFGSGLVAATRVEYRVLVDLKGSGETIERAYWFALAAMAMTAVGVGNAMAIGVAERFREIGTLKCIGASNRLVASIYFLEALGLGVLGCGVGSWFGSWISFRAHSSLWSTPIAAESAAFALAAVFASTIVPTVAAARMHPISAMRVEA